MKTNSTTQKELDDRWLHGYNCGYRDAIGDAHTGIINGLRPDKNYKYKKSKKIDRINKK